MRVQILLFGVLKDLVSGRTQVLDLPAGATVESVLSHYRRLAPEIEELSARLAVAVNGKYAQPSLALAEGDEVALLPPVSGGSGEPEAMPPPAPSASSVAIIHEPIDSAAAVTALKDGADGAVVVFEGTVRNNTRGRRTLYLTYEAYEEMALRMMGELAREAVETQGVRSVTLIHRLGRLEIGETSIFIAVGAAHRAQAFQTCRWLIDTLKTTIPIWKKEHFVDGAVWADGEPFPNGLVEKDKAAK